jgi:hypothetical protein
LYNRAQFRTQINKTKKILNKTKLTKRTPPPPFLYFCSKILVKFGMDLNVLKNNFFLSTLGEAGESGDGAG